MLQVTHDDNQPLEALLAQAVNQTFEDGDAVDFGKALGLVVGYRSKPAPAAGSQ